MITFSGPKHTLCESMGWAYTEHCTLYKQDMIFLVIQFHCIFRLPAVHFKIHNIQLKDDTDRLYCKMYHCHVFRWALSNIWRLDLQIQKIPIAASFQ